MSLTCTCKTSSFNLNQGNQNRQAPLNVDRFKIVRFLAIPRCSTVILVKARLDKFNYGVAVSSKRINVVILLVNNQCKTVFIARTKERDNEIKNCIYIRQM